MLCYERRKRHDCRYDSSLLTVVNHSDFPWDANMTLLDANENSFGPCIPGQDAAPSPRSGAGAMQSALDPKKLQLHRYPNA